MIDQRIAKIKVHRGKDSQRKLVTFEEGELVYSTDKKRLYIGNGNEQGGILVSNRNYVKNSLGVPPVVPDEAKHGDIIHDKSNSKTYITKFNGTTYELILISDSNCGAQLQNQINDLTNRMNQMAGCLAPKPPPVIPPVPTKLSWYDEPSDISINLGDTITLSSSANGGIGTVFYNWRRTDNITVLSNTNKNLTITNALDSDIATYYCVANNDTESITSRNAIVSLKPPTVKLVWTTEPSDTTVNLGENVVFYSNATGIGTITYTWKRRDENSINSTNSNLANITIDSSIISDIATYYCVASNVTESITSRNAVLDILANSILAEDGTYVLSELSEFIDWEESGLLAPTITTQPRSLVTTTLVPVTFSIEATGSVPLSYQWRIDGVDINGETSSSYVVTNPTKDITGITCKVSNIVGFVISNSVNLTVGIKPSIVTQPISQSISIGSSVTFSVVAVGSNPLSYQWSKDGSAVTGATSNTYTINSVENTDLGNYSCVVSNIYGNITSSSANLQIITKFKDIAARDQNSFFVGNDGTLFAVGKNNYGKLGDGTTLNRSTPVKINLPPVAMVVAGEDHSLFLGTDGTLSACGYNNYGQLGDGTTTDRSTPVKINLPPVAMVVAGYGYSLFLGTDETLSACGYNNYGQLGDGTKTDRSAPVKINLPPVAKIAAGFYHSFFLGNDGTLSACGQNDTGQLGDGTTTDRSTPVKINF